MPEATEKSLPSERLGVPPTTPDVDEKPATPDAPDAPTTAQDAEPTTESSVRTGRESGERDATGGKSMSLMDAAINILSQSTGDPMRCKDIVGKRSRGAMPGDQDKNDQAGVE